MSAFDSPRRPAPRKIRSDGWTPERQLRFLDALAESRSVATAAAFSGMSREGAYRFRNRSEATLFALLWDRVLACDPPRIEVHTTQLTNGQIARLLGNDFRRERGDFLNIGSSSAGMHAGDRTRTL
jgi:hypothetical protein